MIGIILSKPVTFKKSHQPDKKERASLVKLKWIEEQVTKGQFIKGGTIQSPSYTTYHYMETKSNGSSLQVVVESFTHGDIKNIMYKKTSADDCINQSGARKIYRSDFNNRSNITEFDKTGQKIKAICKEGIENKQQIPLNPDEIKDLTDKIRFF